MAINKKLITFAKKDVFLGQAGINNATSATNGYYNNIPAHSIVFIKDTGEIWQDGKYYGNLDSQILNADSNTDYGIVFKENGKYYKRPLYLWGNQVDGNPAAVDGDLKVSNVITYGSGGISKIVTNGSEPILTFRNLQDVVVPSGSLEINGGNITVNQSGTLKFQVDQATGNVTAIGKIKGSQILNTPTYIASDITKGKTWTSIKQYSVSGQTIQTNSLASNPPAYLTIQEGPHSADYNWKPWIADADSTSHASWGIGLSGDNFYIGRVAVDQATNALTNAWIFDNSGYITASGYKVPDGTSEGFLKADGSVDTGSYMQDSWLITYSPTSIVFSSGNWVNSGIIFSDYTEMTTGAYLLCINDSTIYYTGVFTYCAGNITTDEEILLHACGIKHTYNSGPDGILYAKIKKNANNKAALFLAYNQNITNTTLDIKIKKLASI